MQYTYYTTLRPGQIGRILWQELLAIASRGEVNPGSPFTALVFPSGLLLVPVGTTSLLARNHHHARLLSMRRSTRCKPCLTI